MAETRIERHKKLLLALKQHLIGKKYHRALKMLAYAEQYHWSDADGQIRLRKDGSTPEFFHQVEIALFITTLEPYLLHPEATICVALGHDVFEDYSDKPYGKLKPAEYEDLYAVFCDGMKKKKLKKNREFTELVIVGIKSVTKIYKGVKQDVFYHDNAMGSILKGSDRINNQQSCIKPFSLEKRKSYLSETRDDILPAIKKAQWKFVEQHMAYEIIKYMLKSQIEMIEAINEAEILRSAG